MTLVIFALALLPFVMQSDPAPGLRNSKSRSRQLECERITTETGSERYPGEIVTPGPRGEYIERSAVVCTERFMRPGLRVARDEAILSSLEPFVSDLTATAGDVRPELEERTWLVEAHYPSAQVATKIAFAAKNALVGQGLRVSDRTPVLGAGDVDVLTRMPPEEAYAAACRRYLDNGSLGEGDALLAVMVRDPRETMLHAGLCVDGNWMWVK